MKQSRDNPAWIRSGSWNWLIAFAVLVGVSLTLGISLIVRDWEQQSWKNDFQQLANAYHTELTTAIGQRIELVEYLNILHELSDETSVTAKYIQTVLRRHPEINYIGWIARVEADEREAFVAAQREAGFKDYDILERDETGVFSPAPERPVYYPLTNVRPLERFGYLLGRTPTSEYCLDRNYIEQAIQQRKTILSIPQKLDQQSQDYAIKIYLPVWDLSSPDPSQATLQGVVTVVFDLSRLLLNLSLQNEAHARHLNVSLFDVTNPTERLMIYGETSALSSEIMAGNLNPEREEEELYPTPFANRHWLLLVSPTEEMASTRSRWLFLLTLTAGLIITALVYAFLDSFARHTREVEEKVGDRTHQLSKANALLADQIRQKEAVFEELSKSETRFRLLTENSTDIIARHDLEGVCLYASSAAKHLLGYDPEEMVGHSIYPLLYKSDIDPMRKLHSTLLDSDEVYTIVYRAKHKDGHYIWFEASCLAIRDEETGEAAEIQSVSRDITARKKAEEALRENEERFRGAFEDAAIGMALVDDSGKIQRVNHSLCQISGYPREELISSDLQSITHPADMAQSLEKMAMVLEGRARVFHLETRLMHKKGYIVWAMISATLVRNHSDEAGYFVMQVQDITDRKRAEKALESLNTKHKLILNAAGEGIVGLDTEGRVTFANLAAEKLLGYELGELQGKPFHSWVLHTREDATPYPFRDSPLFQALHLGKTNSVPMELFWRKDQSNFKASYVCAPIQTQESISGAVIVFSDASETQIGTMARKLMRGESPTRKKIWSEEGNDPGGASS